MILRKALRRRADGSNEACPQVGLAAYPIVKLAGDWVIKQAVHRKIPAARVGNRIAETHLFRMSPVPIFRFRPESRHLVLVVPFDDDNHAKLAANGNCSLEQPLDLLRKRRRDDVIIARFTAQQEITNAPADPERFESGFL